MGTIVLALLVSAILIFVGVYFLFRKFKPQSNPLSNVYFWVTSVIIVPTLCVGLSLLWLLYSSSYEPLPFNQEKWLESKDQRYLYVNDLIDHKKLIGLSPIEVKNLLGEASYTDDSTMSFIMGPAPRPLFNMNPDNLEITLENGKVIYVYINY